MKLPSLTIKGHTLTAPIVQGGMGIGVSLHPLARAVAEEGGAGIISSAGLDRLLSKRNGRKYDAYEAAYEEASLAKDRGGVTGINIMVALVRDYVDSVKGALDAGVDLIISGAGLPMSLPSIAQIKDTALVPIVSSARALKIIIKRWERQKYRPDAVVLEGPLAGGHLGFGLEEIDKEENRLETLLPPVKEMAQQHGDIPVIVAGGIYTHEDIVRFLKLGADGVQMGTRFLATEESTATEPYKQAVLRATQEDIVIAVRPASPCGFPFRVLRESPMYVEAQQGLREPKCDKGYVLLKDEEGKFTKCPAKLKENAREYFCICNGLLSSADYNADKEKPLYTVGTNAHRIDRIMSVHELMSELKASA